MKKRLFSLLLVAILAFTLVSCGGGGGDDDDNGGGNNSITLTYASWGDREIEQALIDAFKVKYPNIEVIIDTTITGTGSSFTANLVTAAQAGILPDVFVIDNVPTVIKAGLVRDISQYWNADADTAKVYENIAETALYGDVRLAMPSFQYIKGIYVNTTLLENLGIEKPGYDWTWEDFIDILDQVKQIGTYGGYPIHGINGYYGVVDWEKTMAAQESVATASTTDDMGYDSWNGEEFNYTSDLWLKWRENTELFHTNGYLEAMTEEEKLAVYGASDAYPFGAGHVVFGIEGSWNVTENIAEYANSGFEVEYYPYPGYTVDSTTVQCEPVILDYMCVSSQTAYPEEAYLLAKWMSFGEEGWTTRLDIMEDRNEPLECCPVADYPAVWTRLNEFMDEVGDPGLAYCMSIIGNGIPDTDKWLPGYMDFWNYITESEEEQQWYTKETEELARLWEELVNQYVSDAYTQLNLSR